MYTSIKNNESLNHLMEVLLTNSAKSTAVRTALENADNHDIMNAVPMLQREMDTKTKVAACKAELKRRGILLDAPVASESVEQQALFRWAAAMSGRYPELEMMFHIPNERKCSRATGGRLKAEGVKKGVPDILLPVARGRFHGLFIEMKRIGGKLSKEQVEWMKKAENYGYATIVCEGWIPAKGAIEIYLSL